MFRFSVSEISFGNMAENRRFIGVCRALPAIEPLPVKVDFPDRLPVVAEVAEF